MYVLINFVCMKTDEIKTEIHPLEPFFPQGARLLMMGSFPPKRERWKMDFYYPNFQNDMWRIFGLVFFDDKEHFLTADKKSFCEQRIRDFLIRQGIALTDSGREVVRQKDNASDKFLEIVRKIDLSDVLRQLPHCVAIATTGQKATDTLLSLVEASQPPVGGFSTFHFEGRKDAALLLADMEGMAAGESAAHMESVFLKISLADAGRGVKKKEKYL